MALARTITVMDVYDRAKTGEKVEEKDWDFKIVPKTASMLKKKYGIKMNKKQIIPTDRELCSISPMSPRVIMASLTVSHAPMSISWASISLTLRSLS